MRRVATLLVIVLAFGVPAAASSAPEASRKSITTKRLIKRFKRVTKGDRVVRDQRASWVSVGATVDALRYRLTPSQSSIGKYGQFVLYVARGPEAKAEVDRLLADIHTALPIKPNRKGIRWESNLSPRSGTTYWTAKTRYAKNVVLVWNSSGEKATGAAWKRLHRALRNATR